MSESNILQFKRGVQVKPRREKEQQQAASLIEGADRFVHYKMALQGVEEDMFSDPYNIYSKTAKSDINRRS